MQAFSASVKSCVFSRTSRNTWYAPPNARYAVVRPRKRKPHTTSKKYNRLHVFCFITIVESRMAGSLRFTSGMNVWRGTGIVSIIEYFRLELGTKILRVAYIHLHKESSCR